MGVVTSQATRASCGPCARVSLRFWSRRSSLFFFFPAGVRHAQGKAVGPPEVAWKDLTYQQKKAFMKAAVKPAMKPIFQVFDPKRFKKFDCDTCHGKDGVERKFKMPSNDIHPLPNTKEAFEAKLKAEPTWPKWTEFMATKVEPAMGKVLDVPGVRPQEARRGRVQLRQVPQARGRAPSPRPPLFVGRGDRFSRARTGARCRRFAVRAA